jgi:excisionase family DNA binding protein
MYEDWLTKMEVRQRTGISERTLERKIQQKEIRREYRNIPGRKPLSILHPDDVKELIEKTLKPGPLTPTVSHAANNAVRPKVTPPDLAAFLAALKPPTVTLDKKVYLSLQEAATFSGLPKSHLRQKLQQGVIPGVKLAGWRIKPADLMRYDAATGTLAA